MILRRAIRTYGVLATLTILTATSGALGGTDELGFENGDGDMTPMIQAEPIEPIKPQATTPNALDATAPLDPVAAPSPVESAKPTASEAEKTVETTSTANASAESSPSASPPPSPVAAEQTSQTVAPDPADADEQAHQAALESPTRSLEAYEEARKERIFRSGIPSWAFSVTAAPMAFRKADVRVPQSASDLAYENPKLMGVQGSAERVLVKSAGLLSLGLQAGAYGSMKKDPFKGLLPGFLSLGPYAQYQLNFLRRQFVVPFVAFEYEVVRYSYSYNNKNIRGLRGIPRFDLGAMIYLNFLEPSAASEMRGNWGIKRTYLTAALSVANDSAKQDLDLSERTLRAGFRFEY